MAVIGPNYVFNVQTRFCILAAHLKGKELINIRIKGIILMLASRPPLLGFWLSANLSITYLLPRHSSSCCGSQVDNLQIGLPGSSVWVEHTLSIDCYIQQEPEMFTCFILLVLNINKTT